MERHDFPLEAAEFAADASGCSASGPGARWFEPRAAPAPGSPLLDRVHRALGGRIAALIGATGDLAASAVEPDFAQVVTLALAESGEIVALVALPVSLGAAAADALFGGAGDAGDNLETPVARAAAQALARDVAALVAAEWGANGRPLEVCDPPATFEALTQCFRAESPSGAVTLAYASSVTGGTSRLDPVASPRRIRSAPAEIELRAVIDTPSMRVAAFAALAEGMTIPLAATGAILLVAGGRELARGELVALDARRAVRVTAVPA